MTSSTSAWVAEVTCEQCGARYPTSCDPQEADILFRAHKMSRGHQLSFVLRREQTNAPPSIERTSTEMPGAGSATAADANSEPAPVTEHSAPGCSETINAKRLEFSDTVSFSSVSTSLVSAHTGERSRNMVASLSDAKVDRACSPLLAQVNEAESESKYVRATAESGVQCDRSFHQSQLIDDSEREGHSWRCDVLERRGNSRKVLKCFLHWHRRWYLRALHNTTSARATGPPPVPSKAVCMPEVLSPVVPAASPAKILHVAVDVRTPRGAGIAGPGFSSPQKLKAVMIRSPQRRPPLPATHSPLPPPITLPLCTDNDDTSLDDLLKLLSHETRCRVEAALALQPLRGATFTPGAEPKVVDARTPAAAEPSRSDTRTQQPQSRATRHMSVRDAVPTREKSVRRLVKQILWHDLRQWRGERRWDVYAAAASVAAEALQSLAATKRRH